MFILLFFCTEGMSTSLLAWRMENVAKVKGIECRIEAQPYTFLADYADEADIIMMGPQDRFQYNNVKKAYASKPVVVIGPKEYGTMDGEKVLMNAIEIIKKQK